MSKKVVYPCPKCNSMDVQPIKDNPKYDSGNIFGFIPGDYRKLPRWICNICNFCWNNYKKKMKIHMRIKNETDQLVYKPYGLTSEEIKIVEAKK